MYNCDDLGKHLRKLYKTNLAQILDQHPVDRIKVNWIRLSTPWKVNKSGCAPKGSWWHHDSATFFQASQAVHGADGITTPPILTQVNSLRVCGPKLLLFLVQKAGVPNLIQLTLGSNFVLIDLGTHQLMVCWHSNCKTGWQKRLKVHMYTSPKKSVLYVKLENWSTQAPCSIFKRCKEFR